MMNDWPLATRRFFFTARKQLLLLFFSIGQLNTLPISASNCFHPILALLRVSLYVFVDQLKFNSASPFRYPSLQGVIIPIKIQTP